MIVLGIDPGTATTGYGIIEKNGEGISALEWGLIETAKEIEVEKRLLRIYEEALSLFEKHKPDVIAIEKLFFATNAKTAMRVGQAQGVLLLASASASIPVFEYAPMSIKKVISGDGKADKRAIQKAVRKYLGRKVRSARHAKTHFDNAADGLAVALCHIIKGESPPSRKVAEGKGGDKNGI